MTFCSRKGCILVVFLWLSASSPTRCIPSEEFSRVSSSSTSSSTTTTGDTRHVTDRLLSEELSGETAILLEFRQGISSDPSSRLGNWNLTVQPNICNWTGIVCDVNGQHVVTLNLTGNVLQGLISPALGGLRFLETLVLSDNKFTGNIPSSLGLLENLVQLDLSNNELLGTLPLEITNCTTLVHWDLSNNFISGSLPSDFGSFINLQSLDLRNNDFTDEIPSSLGNCSLLESISLGRNHLTGPIPSELGRLASLEVLILAENYFTGTIPTSIPNGCQNLTHFDASSNRLYGEIIPELGQLQKLKVLWLHENNFSGSIPASIGGCASLANLILGPNPLSGYIPSEIGMLKRLINLVITGTKITGPIPDTLSNCTNLRRLQLGNNELSGHIPTDLSNLLNLTVVELANNKLSGRIPSSLGALRSLGRLDARDNQLTGSIPPELGRLRTLVELHLSGNSLTGSLMPEIGDLTYIQKLNLNNNYLSGKLPPSLANCSAIIELNLAGNNFSGPVPGEIITGLRTLSYLYLQNNQFSGPIPEELGDSEFIIVIDLSSNSFNGSIPPSLGRCKGLELLNVSNNHLTGELPSTLGPLPILTKFSVAYNNLSGPIPLKGFYANLTESSFTGNPGLCGPQVQRNCTGSIRVAKCNDIECGRRWVYAVSGVAGFFIAVLGLAVILWIKGEGIRRNSKKHENCNCTPKELRIFSMQLQLTAEGLWEATEGFSETNILGVGGYSTVYKGVLPSGMPIAVKRLNIEEGKIGDEYDLTHELQILRGLRHKNLLEVYGFVLTPEFRALVLEFIPNGSLHFQLHKGEVCPLSWETRVNIAVGVADAMIHLHHECHKPIIHRDLKPSNILLDPDYNPRVADFGIAKNVRFDGNGETTASGLFGTTGYIAPEYATSNKVSTKGDVYSYGVVILEMVTRKQPTDDTFTPGTWLSLWVLEAYPDRIHEILDPSLKDIYRSQEREIHMLIRIGLLCTRDAPNERPSMKEVREMLAHLKDHSRLSNRTSGYASMWELEDTQNGSCNCPNLLGGSNSGTGSYFSSMCDKSTSKKSHRKSEERQRSLPI